MQSQPFPRAQACEVLLNGNLTPAALRRERDRGNLVTERIANKEFVTPAAIAAMRERCRVERPAPVPKRVGVARPAAEVVALGVYGEPITLRDARKARLRMLKDDASRRRRGTDS
ncbi:excisionase [Jiella sp. M17.18]